MSQAIADDLLEVELEAELELLHHDNTIQSIDDIDIGDIFSSSEGDYKLFEFNGNDADDSNIKYEEAENIWQCYFDKMKIEQEKYLNESQNILSQMKQTCGDTLKICNFDRTTKNQSPQTHNELDIITTTIISEPDTDCITLKDEIITQNPCVPSHVIPVSSPKMNKSIKPTPSIIIEPINTQQTSKSYLITSSEEDTSAKQNDFIQQLVEENIQQNISSITSPQLSPKPPSPDIMKDDKDDYQMELEKLENELKEVTQAHHEELETDSTVKWSTLLQESKELYDEYIKTTEKIKRDKERLIMVQYFSGWKVEWERNKRKKLELMKLTQEMQQMVIRLVNKTVIRYQNKDYKLNVWSNLIIKYRHRNIMNKIHCNSSWKLNVVDYIIFHFEQNYESMMNHRNYFKTNCLPNIFEVAQLYKQRRLSVIKISNWYKHQIQKRNMIQILDGINKLCVFRKYYIDIPLKKHILISWMKYIECRRSVIRSFTNKINKNKMYRYICYLRKKTRLKLLQRKIMVFRNTKKERMNYLISQQNMKQNATLCIQSYFRMFYVRSIMNEVKTNLSSINEILTINMPSDYNCYEFKELDENEYIFDESIIDLDLKPMSIPPSPKLRPIEDTLFETASIKESDDENDDNESSESSDSVSSEESEDNEESESDQEIESDEDEDEEKCVVDESDNKTQNKSNKNGDYDSWKFENENVAKSWLKRKNKFKAKRKTNTAQSRLNRFNKIKRKTHSFGSNNRFKRKQEKKTNKTAKRKFVKFGCPQNE